MPDIDNPFLLTVYDKSFARTGWVGDAVSTHITLRHGGQPSGAVTVPAGSEAIELLTQEGCRYTLDWYDERVSSGMVRLQSATGSPSPRRQLTFQLQDDYRVLGNVLGWPSPGAAIGSSPVKQSAEYDQRTGSAEKVLKDFVTANLVTRLARPLTVATNLNRGATLTGIQSRMQPLADVLLPLIDQAGIGVTVKQVGAGLVLDVYTPRTFPLTLSEEAGSLEEVEWDIAPPSLTRVVVGGPGDGVDREFITRINAAAETLYGDVIEGMVDARDIKVDDANKTALMRQRGDVELAAAGAKTGLRVKLIGSETFRYGGVDGVRVGDVLPIEIAPGVVISETLREATLSFNLAGPDEKLTAGERSDDPDRALYRTISNLSRDQRRLQVR